MSRTGTSRIARLGQVLPTRAQKIAAAFVVLYSTCIGFLPLFGTPGYEMAFATGLVVPSVAAIGACLAASFDSEITPFRAIARGAWFGALCAVIALIVSLLHSLHAGACDLRGGILFYALTSGAGVVLGGAWGGVASEIARHAKKRKRLASVLVALAVPLGSIALGVARFVSSPMIFAYDPFVGFFSGTLYDTIIEPGTALYTYRSGSLASLAAALFLARGTTRDDNVYAFGKESRSALFLGVLCAGASLYVTVRGDALGHFSTSTSITEKLGGKKSGARCDVVYPSTVSDEDAALLVRDCEEELRSAELFFDVIGPPRVTAFFFRDAAQKRELMGAEHTYIAKPWRNEVYLQVSGYPHPVLGHEIAHVVAGSFGSGPFHVAGMVDGLIPNPGLIEGVAVAASPDDEVLTDDQWARAMKDAKILPPMKSIFSLEFLGGSSSKSYTLAGSFIRFLMRTRGAKIVREWFGGGDLEALTHTPWDKLESEYLAFLDSLTLPPEAVKVAEARFGHPGIFSRVCPHVVDELRRDAERCRDTHDFDRAEEIFDRALAVDSHDLGSRYERAQMLLRFVDEKRGRADLEALANDEKTPSIYRDRADEALGDIALLKDGESDAHRTSVALSHYEAAHARSLDEDFRRTLDVKMLAAKEPEVRAVIVPFLLGDETHAPDPFISGLVVGRASDAALFRYLVARAYLTRNRYRDALREIDAMKTVGELPLSSVTREAVRIEAVCACATQDRARIEIMRKNADETLSGGRRESVLRMLTRCTH